MRLSEAFFAFSVLLTGTVAAGNVHAAADELTGHWKLNEKLSEEADEAFDGKLRKERHLNIDRESASQRRAMDASQDNYWEAVGKVRERRSSKNLRRLGSAYPLLTSTRLDINRLEDGFAFTYDELLPRRVRPNPAGRVYSAKGDELISDSIGHTLSYWEGDTLVLETDPPDGGRYLEKIKRLHAPERLEYRVNVKLRVLTEPVEMVRIFEPKSP